MRLININLKISNYEIRIPKILSRNQLQTHLLGEYTYRYKAFQDEGSEAYILLGPLHVLLHKFAQTDQSDPKSSQTQPANDRSEN